MVAQRGSRHCCICLGAPRHDPRVEQQRRLCPQLQLRVGAQACRAAAQEATRGSRRTGADKAVAVARHDILLRLEPLQRAPEFEDVKLRARLRPAIRQLCLFRQHGFTVLLLVLATGISKCSLAVLNTQCDPNGYVPVLQRTDSCCIHGL